MPQNEAPIHEARKPRDPALGGGAADELAAFQDFFENAAVSMQWVAADGTILRANRAELELLGYEADDYVGHNVAEFHADADVLAEIMERVAGGETLKSFPARLRCRDGTIRYVLIDSNAYFQGDEFVHARCLTRDRSDFVRIEAELEVSRQRLQALFDNALDAILITDEQGRYVDANPAAWRLTGYTLEELHTMYVGDLSSPTTKEGLGAQWQEFLATGAASGEFT